MEDDDDYELEEPETLPYESIFDWDMQEYFGFYREVDRYQRIREEYASNPKKQAVVDGMWRDRNKYQILRRFLWPPSSCLGFFYTRGYYDDYESTPQVDVSIFKDPKLLTSKSKMKRKKTMGFFAMIGKFFAHKKKPVENKSKGKKKPMADVDKEEPVKSKNRDSLSNFNPDQYDHLRFQIPNLPPQITEATLQRLFHGAKITIRRPKDGKGAGTAELAFEDEEEAAQTFRHNRITKIGDKVIQLLPKKKGVKDRSRRKSIHHHHQLPTGHHAHDNKRHDDHGHSNDKYSGGNRRSDDIDGAPHSMKDYDPKVYDTKTLELKFLPFDTNEATLQKLFPKSNGIIIEPNKHRKKEMMAQLSYNSASNAEAEHNDKQDLVLDGHPISVRPVKQKDKWTTKAKQLRDYDPEKYDTKRFEVTNILGGTKESELRRLFPNTTKIKLNYDDNGSKQIGIFEFTNKYDANSTFNDVNQTEISGSKLKASPIPLKP